MCEQRWIICKGPEETCWGDLNVPYLDKGVVKWIYKLVKTDQTVF